MRYKDTIICVMVVIVSYIQADTIKLYALYTPSHKQMMDEWFLPSIQDDFELIIEERDQECASALYKKDGWKKTTLKKVELIIRAIEDNWGAFFIFSDVDIQFFAPIKEIIQKLIVNKDLIVQKDRPSGTVCSGFFICRANEKTLALWKDVHMYMQLVEQASDQEALNYCLRKSSDHADIVWDYLPTIFFGGGTLTGKLWYPGRNLPIPEHIVMHHANWSHGMKNKIAQLSYVHNHVHRKRVLHNPKIPR